MTCIHEDFSPLHVISILFLYIIGMLYRVLNRIIRDTLVMAKDSIMLPLYIAQR